MKYRVETLRKARRELSAIANWYLKKSTNADVAWKWLDGAQDLIDSLAVNPHRGSIAHESDAFDVTIRELLYGSGRRKTHRILYRIIEQHNLVEVVGIRHHSQRDFTPDDL